MKDLQEVFNQIQVIKKEQKGIKAAYRDALSSSTEYQKAIEDLNMLKEKKKSLENTIQEQFVAEFNKLDGLKMDLEAQNVMLSDIALNKIVQGETVEIVDINNNLYEPVFTVKFKKTSVLKASEAETVKENQVKQAGLGFVPEINMGFE